jgi:hypothetical protein
MSRFVTLSRRLESQMVELERIHGSTPSATQKVKSPIEMDSTVGMLDLEGDRERIAAQAALTVAELSKNLLHPSMHNDCNPNISSVSVAYLPFFCIDNRSFPNPNR